VPALALATALVAAHPGSALAGDLRLEVQGTLAATATGGSATGQFTLRSRVRKTRVRARIRLDVQGVNLSVGDDDVAPEFRASLLPPEGMTAIDLGTLRRRSDGTLRLRVKRLDALFPESHPTLRHFEGGAITVRRVRPEPTTVLTATVPVLQGPAAATWVSSRRSWGRFEAIDRVRQSPGSFQLRTESHSGGEFRNRVNIVSSRLSAASYRVYLINRARSWTADIGAMKLLEGFGAVYDVDSRRAALPSGVTNLASFDGGRIEVRRGGTVVLRAGIPELRGVDEPSIRQRVALARGTEGLVPPGAPGLARGVLTAGLRVTERSRRRQLALDCVGLDPSDSPFQLVVAAPNGPRFELGRFDARRALGRGRWRVRPGGFPAGSGLLDLSQGSVEVLDRFGEVVLSGAFPRIE